MAVDPETREVGSAGASCTPYVVGVARLVPGRGAIVAQAMSNMEAQARGAELLDQGADAPSVAAAISDPGFDASATEQQYGVAALGPSDSTPSEAAYTGAATPPARGHRLAPGVSVQGNILVAEAVLDATLAAYRQAAARRAPLAERLLLALEAGSRAGGDARCGAKTAQSAYLGVARPSDMARRPSLRLVATTAREDGRNPVHMIRHEFDRIGRAER